MRITFAILLLTPMLAATAWSQLSFVPEDMPQAVFTGNARLVRVKFHNAGNQPAQINLRSRLYLVSSATAISLDEPRTLKMLQVLPGQTVLESIPLNFPAVTNGTRFLVQWLDDRNKVLGRSDVLVYPDNLLEQLKTLAGDSPVGIFDPEHQLQPLLNRFKIEVVNLEPLGFKQFTGKLAILGPFQTKAQLRDSFAGEIPLAAQKGVAIIWFQPPPDSHEKITPSFYLVPEGNGTIMVVHGDLIAGLAGDPQAQLNLVYFCRLALNPQPPTLPSLAAQP